MSGSFLLVKMDAFPDANMSSIDAPYQHVLGEDFADLDPPHTVFNFSRRISELNIRVYHCTHEERVNKQGRYGNVNFPFYIGKYTFSSYYAEEQNILIIKTSKQIAKRAIRQLSKHEAVDYSTRDMAYFDGLDNLLWFGFDDRTLPQMVQAQYSGITLIPRFDRDG